MFQCLQCSQWLKLSLLEMTDNQWMREALAEAQIAYDENEVPVGAIIIHNNKIIGRGHNRTISLNDPTAHAEIIAISAAANYLHSWRMTGAVVYTTVEPCLMCCGALTLARINKLVFGAFDRKFGACGSVYNIPEDNKLNHKFQVVSGILAEQSQSLLQKFFKLKRAESAYVKKPNTNKIKISEDTNIGITGRTRANLLFNTGATRNLIKSIDVIRKIRYHYHY